MGLKLIYVWWQNYPLTFRSQKLEKEFYFAKRFISGKARHLHVVDKPFDTLINETYSGLVLMVTLA